MEAAPETVQGYVVESCVFASTRGSSFWSGPVHTKACTLMGHCIESGYGLVDEGGRIHLLDPKATPDVVRVVTDSPKESGIRLRVRRELSGDEMETRQVEEV